MKQEDKQFLAELAKELNTKDNTATANPIWCIMDKKIVTTPNGYGNFKFVVGDELCMPLGEFVESIINEVPEALREDTEKHCCLIGIEKTEIGLKDVVSMFQRPGQSTIRKFLSQLNN